METVGNATGVTGQPLTPEQSEGNGVAGSAPGQPEITSVGDKETTLRQLQPADRKAYLSYQYAESKAGKRLQDREAYDWLHENGIDQDKGDPWRTDGLPASNL